jgi:hypothetical protein
MSTRVSLANRWEKDKTELDPAVEAAFVHQGNAVPQTRQESGDDRHDTERQTPTHDAAAQSKPIRRSKQAAPMPPGLIPVNVRVRPELARALKTASLDRQMRGIEPHSKREMIEAVLEPWLRDQGYLAD